MFIGLILLVLVYFGYKFLTKQKINGNNSSPKQEAIKIGTHSIEFNNSIDTMLDNYFDLANAFVNGDSISAKAVGEKLVISFNHIPLAELKKDTSLKKDALLLFAADSSSLTDAQSFADSLTKETDLAKMRQDFSTLNENLYPLLKGINYNGKNKKLYWQNCPMAFGEDNGANWISDTEAIRNPYLGRKMISCGEVKDTIKAQ